MNAKIFTQESIIETLKIKIEDDYTIHFDRNDNQVDITANMSIDIPGMWIMTSEIFENSKRPGLNILLKTNIECSILHPIMKIENEIFNAELEKLNLYVKHLPNFYGFTEYDIQDQIYIVADVEYDKDGNEIVKIDLTANIEKHLRAFNDPIDFDIVSYIKSEMGLIGYSEITPETDMDEVYRCLEAYYLVEEMKEI